VSFAIGDTSEVVTINVDGDTEEEPDEEFTVTLSAPTGASLGTPSAAIGTIQNDEAPLLSIAATDANKQEGLSGNTAFTFTVTRTGDTSAASSATFTVTGSGTNAATADDFENGTFPTGIVSFAIGDTSEVITINVNGDADAEEDEGFTVTLSAPSGAGLGSPSAMIGSIVDDDTI
jgi:hypothetical protein